MEQIIDVLLLFIGLNCMLKLSLWKPWQRMVYSLALGIFAYAGVDYAMLQSKTQLADYLHNTVALQNMAAIVSMESVCCIVFALSYLQGRREEYGRRWWQRMLFWYPGLLMFPVVFYLLTQTLFAAVGVPFTTTALLFATGIAVLLPLAAGLMRRLLPGEESRVEIHLLLSIFVCVLGLVSTETGQLTYQGKETPVDRLRLVSTVVGFLLLAAAGVVLNRLKWWWRNRKEKRLQAKKQL